MVSRKKNETIENYHIRSAKLGRRYRYKNREKENLRCKLYKELHREEDRIRSLNWAKSHPEECNLRALVRRSEEIELGADLTVSLWLENKLHYLNECAYCGSDGDGYPLEKDHILAHSKGGALTMYNIVPACRFCNRSKHDSDMIWWYQRQTFYSPDRLSKICAWINQGRERIWK
jgi:5-methylcytosine-specific restriction endonuclease McrA